MGASCCQSQADVGAEFNTKNVENEGVKKPDRTPPVEMGTNEDVKLRQEVDEIWMTRGDFSDFAFSPF